MNFGKHIFLHRNILKSVILIMSRCNCQILAIPKERRRIHPAPNQRFKTGLLLGYDKKLTIWSAFIFSVQKIPKILKSVIIVLKI